MNAFLNPRNGASLTNIIDVTAHSINLFQENEQPNNINDMFIPKTDISIAEPIQVQMDELGNKYVQVYQFIGATNDEKAGGLGSLLNYMNENRFSKDDPAINGHRYHITKQQYNEETHNTYNIDNTKTYNIKNNIYTYEHYYNKTHIVNINVTNNISKQTLYIIMHMYSILILLF